MYPGCHQQADCVLLELQHVSQHVFVDLSPEPHQSYIPLIPDTWASVLLPSTSKRTKTCCHLVGVATALWRWMFSKMKVILSNAFASVKAVQCAMFCLF